MTTRVIYITECCHCPHIDDMARIDGQWVYFCGIKGSRKCPPTGTPDWCPLEILEPRGSAPDGTQIPEKAR